MHPVEVLTWTAVVVFVVTAVITLLGLIGKLKLGGGDGTKHDDYLTLLVKSLLVELVAVCIALIYGYNQFGNASASAAVEHVESVIEAVETPDSTAIAAALPPALRDSFASAIARPDVLGPEETTSPQFVPNAGAIVALRQRRPRVLTAEVYASSDGERTATASLEIPSGYRYVSDSVRVTTRSGEAGTSYATSTTTDRGGERVLSVRLTARVEGGGAFSPRRWIGAVLRVVVVPEPRPTLPPAAGAQQPQMQTAPGTQSASPGR